MKFIRLSLLIFSLPLILLAEYSQETLYIFSTDVQDASKVKNRSFLVSNSFQDSLINVEYWGGSTRAEFFCGGKLKKILKLKRNKPVQIRVPYKDNSCVIRVDGLQTVNLINDESYSNFYKKFNVYDKFNSYKEFCSYNQKDVYYTNDYPNMSCSHNVENIEIMSDSIESFLIKLEVLLGYKPPVELITDQNPYARIDFTKAPRLDAIYLSTLLYQNDFTGHLLSRILKFHASRGTMINIIGTGYMHSDKAKRLLRSLSHYSPNIRVQEYKYYEDSLLRKLKFVTNYLRDMHVKLLITLSDTNPKDNILIIGGRNVHDGFLFKNKPLLTKYPELDQVAPEDDFAYWQDVEFKIQSKELAETTYAHLLKFWNRNLTTTKIEPIASTRQRVSKINTINMFENQIRHFISIPFEDDQALEKLYIEMIDSAKKSIVISSPYLRPTTKIMNSIVRAINRGIDISIQTRIDLTGDTQASLYEETNKSAINDLYKYVKLYEWQADSILHSKLLIIDDDLSFIGSVNLSRRSFIQDVENGMLVKSKKFNKDLRVLVNSYQVNSRKITSKQKRVFWASVVVYLFQNQF